MRRSCAARLRRADHYAVVAARQRADMTWRSANIMFLPRARSQTDTREIEMEFNPLSSALVIAGCGDDRIVLQNDMVYKAVVECACDTNIEDIAALLEAEWVSAKFVVGTLMHRPLLHRLSVHRRDGRQGWRANVGRPLNRLQQLLRQRLGEDGLWQPA